ncbi:MAG: arylsulfotransferase family protein [Thermonemataceae bacterium]
MSRFSLFIWMLVSCILYLSSCRDNSEPTTPVVADQDITFQVEVSTGTLYPAFQPDITEYYISSSNTLREIEVNVKGASVSDVRINGSATTTNSRTFRLNKAEDITVTFNDHEGEARTYTIYYLPNDLMEVEVTTSDNPAEGYILINQELYPSMPDDSTYIAILDNEGFPVYYKRVLGVATNFQYFELPNGTKRFTYHESSGDVVVMNLQFEEVDRVRLLPHGDHQGYPTDFHDVILLGEDHYVVPAYVTRQNVDLTELGGQSAVDLVELVFQEIKAGQVIFEWSSADHPALLNATDDVYLTQYATASEVDYFHFTSFVIDPSDNHFVVSARHTNQIYKIHRTTGEILWRLGGKTDDFELPQVLKFSHQHHATITKDGTLLFFDNGNTRPSRFGSKGSKIMEFTLDEVNKVATSELDYLVVGKYMDFMGSAQRLANGHTLIGWGGNTSSQQNADKSDIRELSSDNDVVLEMFFTNPTDRFTYSYRALKYNIDFN